MNEDAPDLRTAEVDTDAAHVSAAATVDLPDRWRLLELLGSGGQATVWLAEDQTLGQRVALKILPADADERTRARWLEEVRQGRRLSHPNLIRIFDVVETSDRPVAVMEFIPGGTLADRVVAAGAQPVEDVVRWAGEILKVLAYLHDNRIVHRDVKPSNLLVAEDGSVKLSDLGLVRHMDRSSDLTRTLEGVGTPRFMAPEQLRGERPSPSCDLYSFGVTLYQLLTGRLPFDGDSAFQIADGHLHARPTGVREHRPECPRWLARFVERLLEKQAKARFASAHLAAAALERRRVGLSRRALHWAAAVAVAVAVVTATAFAVRSTLGPTLDRVEIEGSEVVARDADNKRLWAVDRPGFTPQTLVADFVGGPDEEAVIGWSVTNQKDDSNLDVIFELYSEAGELIRSHDTTGMGREAFRGAGKLRYLKLIDTGNLLGEGPELVWGLIDPRLFPAMIGATSFRLTADRPLLTLANSGHIQNLSTADDDGDGRDEIIAIVLNNPMGFQRVLVTISASSRLTGEACGAMNSPDITAFLQGRSTVPAGCLSYTPLGSDVLVVEPPRVTDRGIEFVADGEPRLFDSWGNPESSALFGRGGEAREAFWSDFTSVCARLRLAPELHPPFSLARLRNDHPDVMAEGPTAVAATLVVARALASGGHRENAMAVLRKEIERHPEERDLQLRLGEQLLIGRERSEGRRWIASSVNIANIGRNHNDQCYTLIFDAAVNGDVDAYEATRQFIGNLSVNSNIETMKFLDVAWLFFQGQWGDPRLVEVDPGWVFPWVQLVQAWARFEEDLESDPALKAAAEFRDNNETEDLALLLEARVLLEDGDLTTAAQLGEGARQNLSARCRMDFEACVWLSLAEWTLGNALGAMDGREADAAAMLASAAQHAPGTWIAASLTQ